MFAIKHKFAALALSMLPLASFAVTDSQFFAFAQANYPELFGGTEIDGQYLQYHYAYFPASGNYLVVDGGGNVFAIGPITGNQLLTLGALSTFEPLVSAWSDKTFFQSMRAPRPQTVFTPTLSIKDVVGTYRRNPVQNDYHVGSIALKPGSTTILVWTNQAGVSWNLTPDFSQNMLLKDADSLYQDLPGGKSFTLTYQGIRLTGFKFVGEQYARDGVTPVPVIDPGLHSYFNIGTQAAIAPQYTFGFSFYTAIWPLLDTPVQGFQAGLPGTWLNPDNEDFFTPMLPPDNFLRLANPNNTDYYRAWFQSVEGSGGYWVTTHFKSTAPKYRINGTPNGYVNELAAPGWGFGTNAIAPGAGGAGSLPMGTAGVAQLSNRLLMPPDGLTFKPGTAGEFFGIAWMALPLTPIKGGNNPVGNQNWTFFVNSTNFHGPVAFYVADVWEALAKSYPAVIGRGLDVRPGINKSLSMEMNSMPFFTAKDKAGSDYLRMPRLSFPTDANGTSYLLSDYTVYSAAALFNPVLNWVNGGATVSGKFSAAGALSPKLNAGTIYMWHDDIHMQSDQGLSDYIVPTVVTTPKGGSAWAFQWKGTASNGVFPEYYQKQGDVYKPISAAQVPDETRLKSVPFATSTKASDGFEMTDRAYTSPASWNTPSPVSGPFTAQLNDGSTVTYSWYRFVDQPSLQGFGWSDREKNQLQAVVEKLHRNWKNDTEFMANQTIGDLATLDAALIVAPPAGMEIGFVPVVTGQRNGNSN